MSCLRGDVSGRIVLNRWAPPIVLNGGHTAPYRAHWKLAAAFFGCHETGWEPGMWEVCCSQHSPTRWKLMQHPTRPGIRVGKPVYNYLSLQPNSNLHILLPCLIHTKFSMNLQLPCILREDYILFCSKLCQELDTERITSLAAGCCIWGAFVASFHTSMQAFDCFFMLSICTCLNTHYFIMNCFPFVSSIIFRVLYGLNNCVYVTHCI